MDVPKENELPTLDYYGPSNGNNFVETCRQFPSTKPSWSSVLKRVHSTNGITEHGGNNDDPESEPFKCPFCLQVYIGNGELIKHLWTAHNLQTPSEYDRDRASKIAIANKPKRSSNKRPVNGNGTLKSSAKINAAAIAIPCRYKCHICGILLTKSGALNKHILTVHNETDGQRKWKCSRCPSYFGTCSHLRQHEYRVHNQKVPVSALRRRKLYANKVNQAKLKLNERNILKKDNKTETGSATGTENDDDARQAYKCPYCLGVFLEDAKFIRHLQTHRKVNQPGVKLVNPLVPEGNNSGESRPWKCSNCTSSFRTKLSLRSHKNRVHRGKSGNGRSSGHPCKICGKHLAPNNILIHMRIHSGVRPYKCSECPWRFKQLSNLKRHLRTIHGKVENANLRSGPSHVQGQAHPTTDQFQIRPCKIVLNRCDDLLQNYARTGSTNDNDSQSKDEQLFQCPYCPIVVSSVKNRARHLKTHTGEKSHKCSKCGRAFRTSTNLKRHDMTVHEGVKRFRCLFCSKWFTFSYELARHHRTVHGM